MNHDYDAADLTQMNLRRTPGRRSGCSCCGFTMAALMALPVFAVVALFLIR